MTEEQKKEFEALRSAGLGALPAEARENGPIWVKAVLKVRTFRGGISYALAVGTDGRGYKITRTFDSDGIAKVLSVHPYEHLDRKHLSEPRSRSELVSVVSEAYGVDAEKVGALDEDELGRLLMAIAIRRQLAADAKAENMEMSRDGDIPEKEEDDSITLEEDDDDNTEEDTDNGSADGRGYDCGSTESEEKASGDAAAKPKTRSGKASGRRAGKSKTGRA